MLRRALLASAVAVPVALVVPALAGAEQAQTQSQTQTEQTEKGGQQADGDLSYGEKARRNQPTSVDEIGGLNAGPREAAQFADQDVAGGDSTFALPVSALVGDELRSGDEEAIGEISEIVLSDDGSVHAAVEVDGDRVLVPFANIRVQTGRGPENWMLVTGVTPMDLANLRRFDAEQAQGMTAVSDALFDVEVQGGAGGEAVGTVVDAIVHSTAGIQGLVVETDDRTIMIPADRVTVRRGGGEDGGLTITTDLPAQELAQRPDYVFGDSPAAITAPGSAAAGLAGELVIGDNDSVDRGSGEPTASQMLPDVDETKAYPRPQQADGGAMDEVLEKVEPEIGKGHGGDGVAGDDE